MRIIEEVKLASEFNWDSTASMLNKSNVLGVGATAVVYNIGKGIAYKKYKREDPDVNLHMMEKRLEALSRFNVPNVVIPETMVQRYGMLAGYLKLMLDIADIKTYLARSDLPLKDKIEALLKGEVIIIDCHNQDSGIVLGDINGTNLVIDKNNNIFLYDFDNAGIGNISFYLGSFYTRAYQNLYGYEQTPEIDKFAYALMAIDLLCQSEDQLHLDRGSNLLRLGRDELTSYVNGFFIPNESKEILGAIFSDTKERPYVGPALVKLQSLDGSFLRRNHKK